MFVIFIVRGTFNGNRLTVKVIFQKTPSFYGRSHKGDIHKLDKFTFCEIKNISLCLFIKRLSINFFFMGIVLSLKLCLAVLGNSWAASAVLNTINKEDYLF